MATAAHGQTMNAFVIGVMCGFVLFPLLLVIAAIILLGETKED